MVLAWLFVACIADQVLIAGLATFGSQYSLEVR